VTINSKFSFLMGANLNRYSRTFLNSKALVIFFFLAVVGWGDAASATESRIALVIGNNEYEHVAALSNARNDARLIRQTLEELDFEVIYRENVTAAEMDEVVEEFGDRLGRSGSDAVALFYYAGHGVQSNGQNYLLPVDIDLRQEADLSTSSMSAARVLETIEASGAGTKIVILDACRNNPFEGTPAGISIGKGLADIGLRSSEFFVAFAATAGNLAEDGKGENSPYAEALARRLGTEDSELANTFRLVRIDVSAATQQKQLPESRTTMRQQFYFTGTPAKIRADDIAVAGTPRVEFKVPTPNDIIGKWCSGGRGAGMAFRIRPDELQFINGKQVAKFGIQKISSLPDGRIEMEWKALKGTVIFEFGQFSASGTMMTQLRGKNANDEYWKDYNLRLRKCG
jgi:hypothetical protein